jgi:hypothetical protein
MHHQTGEYGVMMTPNRFVIPLYPPLNMRTVHFNIFILAFFLRPFEVESIVYLRKTNERGPIAWQAGLKCLKKLANVYFYNLESTQPSNLVTFIAKNMSSPAQEIAGQYLERVHHSVFSNQEDDQP